MLKQTNDTTTMIGKVLRLRFSNQRAVWIRGMGSEKELQ